MNGNIEYYIGSLIYISFSAICQRGDGGDWYSVTHGMLEEDLGLVSVVYVHTSAMRFFFCHA